MPKHYIPGTRVMASLVADTQSSTGTVHVIERIPEAYSLVLPAGRDPSILG